MNLSPSFETPVETPLDLHRDPSDRWMTFPLERPRVRKRRRRREPVVQDASLPYFLCGEENRLLAYAATADISVLRIGHPVVLVGPVGVGKTAVAMHLAARSGIAIGMEWDADEPAETVYLPANDLARDYAEAIEVDDLATLQSRLLDSPVLVIDDLEGMAGKFACQQELGRRLLQRGEAGRMTFLTSRRPPDEIEAMDPSLCSRVMAGLSIPLWYPSTETKRGLIIEFALALGLELSPQCIDQILVSLPPQTGSRTVESLLRSLRLRTQMESREVDEAMIRTVVDDVPLRRIVPMDKIVRVTGRHFHIRTSELRGPSRQKTTVLARSLAMWLSRKLAAASTHKIGEHFGGRDHTTVMHALAKMDDALENEIELKIAANQIEDRLMQ